MALVRLELSRKNRGGITGKLTSSTSPVTLQQQSFERVENGMVVAGKIAMNVIYSR